MNIIKIGGAVLKNIDGFEHLNNIINNYSSKPLIIVISAFSSATKELKKSALIAEQGKFKSAVENICRIIDEHKNYATALINNKQVFDSLSFLFDNSKERLTEVMKGLSITKELTARTLDYVMSYGEFFALHTVYHYLQEKQFDVKCIDSTSLIVSDDNFGEAKPLLPETTKLIKEKLVPFAKRQKIILTQGFVAKNKSGEITTMGIESSNLTAVLLAEILNINQITFWTDVSGVMTADPKYIKKTKSIEKLSYQQAYDYARNGLKLIYPEMLNHAASKKIKLIYRSASNPEGSFTEIYDTNKVNDLPIITFFDDVRFMDYKFSSKLPDIVLDGFVSGTIKSKSNILAFNNNQSGFNLIFTPDTDYEAELKRKFPNSNVVNCSYLVVSWKDLLMNLKIIFNLIESEKSNILFYNYTGQNLRIVMKNVGIVDVTAKIHSKIMSSLNKGKNKE